MKSTADKFVYGNGSSEPGQVALKLGKTIEAIQKGKVNDHFGWVFKVKNLEKA